MVELSYIEWEITPIVWTPFTQLKPKIGRKYLLSNFINLNSKPKCKLEPMIKIKDIIIKLEVFQYEIILDINMDYKII